MPLDVSIVITTYNVERYVARAIGSALAQREVNVEVIVIDDRSTDGTWELLAAIDDPRLRLFRLERNSGPGAARNKGFAEAHGDWIAVLDGDDAMEPDRLARCLAQARKTTADMVVDNLLICREADGREFPMFAPRIFSRRPQLALAQLIRGRVNGSGKYTLGYLKPVFSAAFLRRHQLHYDERLRIGEDYMLLAEALALQARCAIEPSAGYRYTVRAGSISHRLSLADLEAMQQADAAFTARFVLDDAVRRAQRKRGAAHAEMAAYIRLVAAIKQRSPRAAWAAVASRPRAVRHLWEPVIKRLMGGFR